MKRKIIQQFTLISFVLTLASALTFTTYQLFLMERGMSIFQMSIVNAVFMISVFLLEIPTGAFADSFGRKNSIIAGAIVSALAFACYFFSTSLFEFIASEIVCALGIALISGALEAWAVDSIAWHEIDLQLEDLFQKEERARQAGAVSGSFLGAYVATYSLAIPWLFSAGAMIIAALCSYFFLQETYFQKKTLSLSLKPLIATTQASWSSGKNNPAFLRIAAISLILAISTQSLNMQWPLVFKEGFHLPMWSMGLLFTGIAIFTAFGARMAPLVSSKGGHDGKKIALSFLIIGLMMILSGQALSMLAALTFFLLHEFGRGLFRPLKKAMINRRLNGSNRATMLSLDSMGAHAGAFIGLLGGGWIGTHYSIATAWSISGLLLIAGVPWLYKKGI